MQKARFVPVVLGRTPTWLVVLASTVYGCNAFVDDTSLLLSDAGDPAREAAAEPGSCSAAGGRCGTTPDLPCDARERDTQVEHSCDHNAPCCVPLPIPDDGMCWDAQDCTAADSPPMRPAAIAVCTGRGAEPGKCSCTSDGTLALGLRCGPALQAGERFLCSVNHSFSEPAGVCGSDSCPSGDSCTPTDGSLRCSATFPPRLPNVTRAQADPREFCAVVNCGSIRCEAPLRCTNPSLGICER